MSTSKTNQSYLTIVFFLVIAVDTMGVSLAWPTFGTLFTGKNTALFASGTSMQWRSLLYGITMGIASLFMFLGAPMLGDLSDRIGRRKVLLFCLLGTSVGMCLLALGITLKQVPILIFSRAWLGAIAACQIIAQAAMVDISNQNNKATNLGVVEAANNIGYIIGPIIGSLLIDNSLVSWFSFTTPFYFAAVLAALNALLLCKTYKETLINPVIAKLHLARGTKVFIRALTHKKIRALAGIYACFQIGWAMYFQTMFLSLIQEYNYSGRLLGCFFLVMGLTFCFNFLVIVRLITHHLTLKRVIYTTLVLASLCCFSTTYSNEVGLWFSIIFMASAISLGGNAMVTTFSNIVTEGEQGWVMGVNSSIAALSWAITPPLAGLLLAFSFRLPLLIAGALFLLGAIGTIQKLK